MGHRDSQLNEVPLPYLSISEDVGWISELIRSGAEGFVVKRAAADELVAAIRVVQKGGIHVDPRVDAALLKTRLGDRPSPRIDLSPREESIIRLIALGYTNKEIASLLELSVKTVEACKARAMEKAGLRNRVEIIQHGARQGWLTSGDQTA